MLVPAHSLFSPGPNFHDCSFDASATCGLIHRSKITSLFDNLVGAGEQLRRHVDAERLGSSEIDDEIEFGWLLDRNVTGLRPAQNLIDVVSSASKQVRDVRSV